MITEPNYNRIRIAVEKVIARHELAHLADSIERTALPSLAKGLLLAGGSASIAIQFRQRVDAICHTATPPAPRVPSCACTARAGMNRPAGPAAR